MAPGTHYIPSFKAVDAMQRLYRKRIVLGVGGGIAAYKAPNFARLREQVRQSRWS
jgi:hypothetical protein